MQAQSQAQSPSPVVPRNASTVVVARDSAEGLQIVLTQRHSAMRFMGGMYVFPGGAVQAGDGNPAILSCLIAEPAAWPEALSPALQLGHAIAAVRETFEEAGLLLGAAPDLEPSMLEQLRAQALAGTELLELLVPNGIRLDLHEMVPFVRWITPQSEPIRFDTRFYVARAPKNQEASHDTRESTELVWRTPNAALEAARHGTLRLSPPTVRTLDEIAALGSVDELLAHAAESGAPTIEPMLRTIDGQRVIVYPGDPEHPVQKPALRGPTRASFPR